MPYQKANEAYFADIFNRPATLAFYNADGSQDLIGYIKDFDVNYTPGEVVEANVTCDIAPKSDYVAIASKGVDGSVSCVIDDIKGDIGAILARLASLESTVEKKNARDDLRSALKTLNYTREL